MARDYENLHDLESLSDRELRDLVRERIADTGGIDSDNVTVLVRDGVVHLTGRVGTEGELRIAEHVLTDLLGISNYENELVVDPNRRSEAPDDPDEARLAEEESNYLGDEPANQSPEAEHLAEDLELRAYGTSDTQQAIERGTAYTPPQEPTPEGFAGNDRGPEVRSEDH